MNLRPILLLLTLIPALLLPGGARVCVCLMDGPLRALESKACCAEEFSCAQTAPRDAAVVVSNSERCADCHVFALEKHESPRLEKACSHRDLPSLDFAPSHAPSTRLARVGSPRASLEHETHAPPGSRALVPLRI